MAGLRKQTKKCSAEQLCMYNVPMGLNESDDSSVSDSSIRRVSFNIVPRLKVVSVDCIHVIWLSIKRDTFTSGDNVKPPFLRQYLVLFKFFYRN